MADLSKLSDDDIRQMLGVSMSEAPVARPVSSLSNDELINILGMAPRDQGMIGNIMDSLTAGATFNFGDEITAAEAAVLGRNPEGDWFNYEKSMGERFDEALEAERLQNATFAQEHPVVSTAAEITGAIAGPGKLAAGAKALNGFKGAVASGAAGGALSGFGAGEDGIGSRLENAGESAAVGAGIGALAYPVAKGLGKIYDSVTSRFSKGGAATSADRKVLDAIANDESTPDRVARRLDMLGPEATLADAGGKNVRGLGRAVSSKPGRAKSNAERVLDRRNATQYRRVEEAAEEGLAESGDSFYENADNLMALRAEKAAPLYAKAYAKTDVWNEKIGALMSRPSMKSAMSRAHRIATEEGRDPASLGFDLNEAGDVIFTKTPSMQTLDYVKRGIDDVLESFRDKTTGRLVLDESGRAINNTKSRFLELLDDANSDYKAARQAWAGPSQSLDALQKGRAFLRGDIEITKKQLSGLSENDKAFFRNGVARQLVEEVRKSPDNSDIAKRLFGTKLKRDRLAAVFPDRKSYQEFEKRMLAEMQMSRTRSDILSGSQTQPRLEESLDLQTGTGVASDLLTGNKIGLVGRGAKAVGDFVSMPQERVRDEIGDMLFSQNQSRNGETLRRLREASSQQSLGLGNERAVIPGAIVAQEPSLPPAGYEAFYSDRGEQIGWISPDRTVAVPVSRPAPVGKREHAESQPVKLSDDDLASPIENDDIAQGRKLIQNSIAGRKSDDLLRTAGMPGTDTDVDVFRSDGTVVSGTVVDAAEEDGKIWIKIALPDGGMIEQPAETLRGMISPRRDEPEAQRQLRTRMRAQRTSGTGMQP